MASMYYVVFPFVLFILVIVLSVFLQYTASDYPFGIFNLFLGLNKWLLISVEIMMYKVNIYLDALSVNKSRVHKSVHRLKWKLRSKTCQNCGGMSHFASFYDLSIGLGLFRHCGIFFIFHFISILCAFCVVTKNSTKARKLCICIT